MKSINLEGSSIRKLPDLCTPNLERLNIRDCENLIDVHEAIGSLDKLKRWDLSNCKKLQILPSTLRLKSLENIRLYGCVSLEKLPDLGAPNLEALDMEYCKNLIEVHEANGSLYKLKSWNQTDCVKLKILPSTLRLKSVESIFLNGCNSLEKFPNIHPEMKPNLLILGDCNIREWSSSLGNLFSGLKTLTLFCQNLVNYLCSLVNFSRYEFTNLLCLKLGDADENMIESHILTRPESFPSLWELDLRDSSIVTIPRSISRFTNLEQLKVENCKKLREISRLPPSIRYVDASGCMSLDLPSSCRLLNQVSSLYINNQVRYIYIYIYHENL